MFVNEKSFCFNILRSAALLQRAFTSQHLLTRHSPTARLALSRPPFGHHVFGKHVPVERSGRHEALVAVLTREVLLQVRLFLVRALLQRVPPTPVLHRQGFLRTARFDTADYPNKTEL